MTCTKEQPKGWHCTRDNGHTGPCALVQDKKSRWSRFVDALGNAIGNAKFGGGGN